MPAVLMPPPMASVYSMPATAAELSVAMIPEIRAETATRDTSAERPGATWDRTPIWLPRDPILPKPYQDSQYTNHKSEVGDPIWDIRSRRRWQ